MYVDVAIIGAGIAGASAAAHIAQTRSVVLIEREACAGYHATGRSAALFSETYGNATVRALSVASRSSLENPPPGFAAEAILRPRGAMHIGAGSDTSLLDSFYETAHALAPSVRRIAATEVVGRVPVLKPEMVAGGGVIEPNAKDIDANELLQGYLRRLRSLGGKVLFDAELRGLARDAGKWSAETGAGTVQSEILVNAAGAWADEIAEMAGARPVGLVPKRRTVFVFQPPSDVSFSFWPLVIGAREDFYFKPDAGNLLVSPADETPSPPTDAQPEEIDVAIAADRLMSVTSLKVRHIARRWAGLRTFAADKTPVVGFDPEVEGFLWLAGQGGYGFQTAPAMASIAAALIAGRGIGPRFRDIGLTEEVLAPARFLRGRNRSDGRTLRAHDDDHGKTGNAE